MKSNNHKPLSPHLSVYQWSITMILSILHRITGIILSIGLILFVIWLTMLSGDIISYQKFITIMQSFPGKSLLIGLSYAFFFHLCNGMRHLVWDCGKGFEKNIVYLSSWLILILSFVLNSSIFILCKSLFFNFFICYICCKIKE